MTSDRKLQDDLLPGLPSARIEACYARAAGNEIARGKFFSPESSANLVANAFGHFLERPAELPPLPGTDALDWPALHVDLEGVLRLPWSGGRHPCFDVLIDTRTALIGVESKRYEPFRAKSKARLSDAYFREVWGDEMQGYLRVRDSLREDRTPYRYLDAAQLMKHALGLRTSIHHTGPRFDKKGVLFYLFATPDSWANGAPISEEERAMHLAEIDRFAALVAGDEITFVSCSYRQLLDTWLTTGDSLLRAHTAALENRYGVD